ncbi:MAG: S8 family serine peptidase [Dokdonella sp.]|uniref:S8 family serine peptidase n=1 Tax=Dokdonella sp. TaxID=2291710 RepID=UPI0025B8A19D|nr:S8 family serine peptidase [Dokdonella sp.]MBK8122715.1 S8 family serine peptidase [Dokdonella sp.]
MLPRGTFARALTPTMRTPAVLAAAILVALARAAQADNIAVPQGIAVPADFRLIADYGSYRLYEGDAAAMPERAWTLADASVLHFDRQRIDTRTQQWRAPEGFALRAPSGAALHVVQFAGPIRQAWLDQLRAAGAVPVQYIESNGYLVWADAAARARLAEMHQGGELQFSQPLPGFIKLGNTLFARVQDASTEAVVIPIIVQRVRNDDPARSRARFMALGLKPVDDFSSQAGFDVARFEATPAQIRELIELSDVLWVEEYREPSLNDEVQAQILRGHFNADQSGPAGPGYLPWLQALGFPDDPLDYPVLDITDDGVGTGSVQTGDPTLHQFGDLKNPTRMVFNQHCTMKTGVVGGHGHLNANIALGFDQRGNSETPGARFPADFQVAQGINPFGRLGGTRIFAPGFDLSACGGTNAGVIAASHAAGARISSNSWGCGPCAGQYDLSSQAYDAGVRDADPKAAGNQQLITIFSAGNDGSWAGTIGTPGNGKNMITVGASENARPEDENGLWNDGCLVAPDSADHAMDIVFFSSRGPAPGGRVKPDLVAPGTHVIGTQAHPASGLGICDATHPQGNETYAASSGTSHAAPAVSAIASLSWWWLATGQGSLEFESGAPAVPSPALMKAWLIAHPTYLTGKDGNDTLPSNAQGFGMPNMQSLFDATPTWLLDQSQILGDSGQLWSTPIQRADASKPLRVVLTWTDAPGAVGTSPQVNNLDLELESASTLWRGNRFSGAWSVPGGAPDAVNTVEAIYLPPGPLSSFTLSVRGFNIAGDGLPGNGDATDQDFALVCVNCAKAPGFALDVTPALHNLCTQDSASATYALRSASILGFSAPLALSVAGAPAGTTTTFNANPMAVPGTGTLEIGNLTGAAEGRYRLAIRAESGSLARTRHVQLQLATDNPAAANLVQPADASLNQALQPLLHWTAMPNVDQYRVELALDAGFANIIYSASTNADSHEVATPLAHATRYYWRVSAINACGESPLTQVFSFVTVPPPGECPGGTLASSVFAEDFESGAGAWSHYGDHDSWSLTTDRARGAGHSYRAQDLAYDSNQFLVSPPIELPVDQQPLSMEFWSHQFLENRLGGCYDGAFVEMSTDQGKSWEQVPASRILIGPYDGFISTSFDNPAGGKLAWCGDPRDWSRTIIDIAEHAGETVQFRFRVATDASTGRVPDGFYLDDFRIQSCTSNDLIFAHGFE